jgi:hypothetical protein
MSLGAPPSLPGLDLVNPECFWCNSWPCRCSIGPTVTCECGGVITAGSADHRDIQLALERHQSRPLHEEWRRKAGL